MAGYGKLVDGRLVRPPRNGAAVDGRKVSGYRRRVERDAGFRESEGWLPLVDERPEVGDGQRAVRSGWEESGGQLVAVYDVVDVEAEPDVEGLLDAVDVQMGRQFVRRMLREFPDVERALSRGRVSRAWLGLAEARDAGEVSEDEFEQLASLAAEHGIDPPEVPA